MDEEIEMFELALMERLHEYDPEGEVEVQHTVVSLIAKYLIGQEEFHLEDPLTMNMAVHLYGFWDWMEQIVGE